MKKSDQKQREKAFVGMLQAMKNLIDAVTLVEQVQTDRLSVDEMNQIAIRIDKLANYFKKIAECRQIYGNENKSS